MHYGQDHKIERHGDYLNIVEVETGEEIHVRIDEFVYRPLDRLGKRKIDRFIYDAF